MKYIREVMDLFAKNKLKKRDADKSQARVEDLFVKLYHFNDKIKIPLPNLYADMEIDKYFGGKDKIDFENNEHIGRILFILENQDDDKMERMSAEECGVGVRKILKRIPTSQKEQYQQAIYEMFIALKKNSIRKEKEILNQTLEILQG